MSNKKEYTTKLTHKSTTGSGVIIVMRGLPASGKSTLAREIQKSGKFAIINKDSLRKMIGLSFEKKLENATLEGQKFLGIQLIKQGYNLIVDDTNLPETYVRYWTNIAKDHDYSCYTYSMNTTLEECLSRDAVREDSVGSSVIHSMYSHFFGRNTNELAARAYAKQPLDKPTAIIVDLDGTLALRTNRGPFDESQYHTDAVNEPVSSLIGAMLDSNEVQAVIFLSGRKGTELGKSSTLEWIEDNIYLPTSLVLHMRDADDNRSDDIVKRELYEEHVKGKYNVKFVLDDRDKVVKMWRDELHLPTFQVYWGNF